ncbi:MAG: MBL fold metallo-hydrolase [Desulfomonilia bacterium]|jgi:glyoxylase-like metal-dependent hydrolase (beta-lactamase superfamily II)
MTGDFPCFDAIHALSLPLVGLADLRSANVYVLGTGPVTIVDTGPKFPGAFEEIERQLAGAGFGFEDVDRIILTHGHVDHFGLAVRMMEAAGRPIPCYLHPDDIWRTTLEYLEGGLWNDEVLAFACRAGVPGREVELMRQRSDFFKHFCDPLESVIPLTDGEVITGRGFSVRVIHTPGHSPGSCCLYEPEHRVLFSGDHLIGHITPNPITELHPSLLSDPGYQSLKAFESSLRKVAGLDIRCAFSGHGECIHDVPALVASYQAHHERRCRQILRCIGRSARPVFDLVEELYPGLPEGELFLAISEVYSHLELLVGRGRAEIVSPGPPALFRAIPEKGLPG